MKKRLSIVLIIAILIAFAISGNATKQDINDMAYVVAIRRRCSAIIVI